MSNPIIRQWYLDCISELSRCFGVVEFDDLAFKWISIRDFLLPDTFCQEHSTLLIATPGMNIENYKGYNFYMDMGLRRTDGREFEHLFNKSLYNNLSDYNYSRLSFHLMAFTPRYPAVNGDRLIDIVQSLYHFLGETW